VGGDGEKVKTYRHATITRRLVSERREIMTIVALFFFLVPFIGLCTFVLAKGIVDILGKRKSQNPNDAATTQTNQEGDEGVLL
jgi:hypothetical protein